MFDKILIANRGEIALRIIRACRELGIKTVVVYSQADRDSLPVRLADQKVCIGPPSPGQSYLNINQIVSAAELFDVDAIHPGYGFLAENAQFCQLCLEKNLTFIGPTPDQIRVMGDKALAKETMRKAGVPVVPGSDGVVETEEQAKAIADRLKYPVIIKASAGGGGRGMRVAHNLDSLLQGFHSARAEAEVAFKNPAVYIEKFVESPHHVEIQVLGDKHGNIIHLGERDCSVQRRHQKLIEESPSPFLNDKLRAAMEKAAVRAASHVKYVNAGTIEFIVGGDGNFYFMEMNTRIQVEHPVTEERSGVDLVKAQIHVAAGDRIERQNAVKLSGHAIECRINAEDPSANFAPRPGRIEKFIPPGGPGVRFDSHAYEGYRIPPNYDSMIGKLIVKAETRLEAIAKMRAALSEMRLEGVKTTIPFLEFIMSQSDFVSGKYDTSYVDKIAGHFMDSVDKFHNTRKEAAP